MKYFVLLTVLLLSFTAKASVDSIANDTTLTTTVVAADTMPEHRSHVQQWREDVKNRITNKLNEPYDTIHDKGYWWRAMKHGKVNFNDESMGYPRFLLFCWKVYKWGDKAFNSYDPDYVVSTGKNWKLTLKNQNWIDNFAVSTTDGNAIFTSGAATNLGLYISFMAVSVGYSLDVDRLIGDRGTSEMLEFSFTCARFTAEAHKTTNTGRMKSRIKLKGGDWHRGDMLNAMRRESMGMSATYFFNNKKYARAAAYCYSKYQLRSAGSFLAGFSIDNYDFKIDTQLLTPDQAQEFAKAGVSHMCYTEYCLATGYAYNWVINPKLLFNATGTVGTGLKHIHSSEFYEASNRWALNPRGSFALTYNHKRFFASLQTNVSTSVNINKDWYFDYTIADFSTVFGIRF